MSLLIISPLMTTSMTGFTALLGACHRSLSRAFEERTRDRALTSAQWRLLVLLTRHGETHQARLAEALEIEPISVSRMLDRMEAGGWVTRAPHPEDRRARLVRPTERAHRSLASLGDVADVVYREATAGFTDAEIAALVSLLSRLNNNITAARSTAENGASRYDAGQRPQDAASTAQGEGQR